MRSRLRRNAAARAAEVRPREDGPLGARANAPARPHLAEPAGERGRERAPAGSRSPSDLYALWMKTLGASPGRPVARSLPGGTALDADTFERRVMGAERRLLRLLSGPDAVASAAASRGRGAATVPVTVLLSARNLDSWIVALAALWKRDFVPLLADADLSRAEIAELVRAFRPTLAILDRPADPPGGAAFDLGGDLARLHAWAAGGRGPREMAARPAAGPPPRLPAGTAIVRLTSGTTGSPRGVALGAAELVADARDIGDTMGIATDDAMVAAIPLGHAYGFVHIVMSMVTRGTRPILAERPLPALLLEALAGRGPIVLPATPYLCEMLLAAAGRRRLPGLRLCLSAGSPLPERLSRAFRERHGIPVRTFYGASECGGIAYDRSPSGIVPDGCVGTPLDGVSIAIRPEDGMEGAGADPESPAGRIVVTSRAVARGYVPEEPAGDITPGRTVAADRDAAPGRFVTGDLGRIDAAGQIHLLGRADRMINVDGRKVNPAEIEAVLAGIEGVREAAVVGVPDRHRGQAIAACVAGRRGLRPETILAACRERLAGHKIPRALEIVDALPKNARGKTDRRALVSLAGRPTRRRS
jgi:acyl-coenzyme A synthetase/AMP-(fatty) acid ligase